MPLSKKRDKERKRLSRLEWLSSPSQTSNAVKPIVDKVLSLAHECIEEGTFVYSKPEEFG